MREVLGHVDEAHKNRVRIFLDKISSKPSTVRLIRSISKRQGGHGLLYDRPWCIYHHHEQTN